MLKKVCCKIDDLKHPRKIIGGFLLTWLILNLFQAIFTELAHDEAYYWVFSRKLAWGYFDHPPMIAFLIKIGYSIFQNELGVRLVPLILGTGTIYLIFLSVKDRLNSLSTFILIIFSIIILKSHVGGFLAIPDVPVIFFSALFFYVYKKYIEKDDFRLAILLGLIGAAMLYSKYHGILVLFFTLLSNLTLFKRKSFYLIPVVIALGMLPHLFWQIENNFPTFQYHLVSRSSQYKIVFTLNYLLGQVLIAGPLIGVMVFFHAVKYSSGGDAFLKAMKYNFYGFFIFFFLMSFKGHVEAHWTAIGFIPAIILSVNSIYANPKALKWLRKLFIPTLVLFLIARISLIVNVIPNKYNIGAEFHNWDTWAQEIKEKANGRYVVFGGTFQRPAKYSFYTGGDFAHSLNHVWYRKNQYDLWGYTDSIQGKKVALFRAGFSEDTICTSTSECYPYRYIDNFRSFDHVPIFVDKLEYSGVPSDSTYITAQVYNPLHDTLNLLKLNMESPRFSMSFYNGEQFIDHQQLLFPDTLIAPLDTISFTIKFINPEDIGDYSCYLSFINNGLFPGFNSQPFLLKVER